MTQRLVTVGNAEGRTRVGRGGNRQRWRPGDLGAKAAEGRLAGVCVSESDNLPRRSHSAFQELGPRREQLPRFNGFTSGAHTRPCLLIPV